MSLKEGLRHIALTRYRRHLRESEKLVKRHEGEEVPVWEAVVLEDKYRQIRESAHAAGDRILGKDLVDAQLDAVVTQVKEERQSEKRR